MRQRLLIRLSALHLIALGIAVSGCLLLANPAAAAIAYVQGTYQNAASGGLLNTTYASAQNVGDLNVVIVGWNDSVSTVASITDSKGNTYVAAVGPTVSSGNATQRIYYAKNISSAAAGSNTVAVTFSTTVAYPEVRVLEYSGIDTVNSFDVGSGASGSGSTQNSGSATTTSANDLLVASNNLGDGSSGAGTGYTQRFVTSGNELVEDKIVTSTGSYNATSTQSGTDWWVMQMAAFRAASTGDTTPPTAPTAPAATVASASQINLSWTASTDNVGVTGYRIEDCSGASCTTFAQIGTSTTTTYNATALTASTSYSFRIRATDAAGNLSTYSTTVTASTSASADTQPPTAPTAPAATVASATQINLTWTASTDNVGVTGYKIEDCSGASCTTFAQIGTATATSYSAAGLTASTPYSFRIRATDAAANLSTYSTTVTATTSAGSDTQAPTAPTAPAATVVSATQINLTWTASTDNVGVTGYNIEDCSGASCATFAQIGTATTASFSATGLTASTSYSFRIRATDAAGNLSTYSTTVAAATSAGTDTQAPTAPTVPAATVASATQINLTWTASTDNVGVTGYKIEDCSGASCTTFAQIGTATTTSYSATGLTASTSYSFRIRATDAAGNLSTYSTTATATTSAAADTQAPTAPTSLTATAASATQINLSWTASTDNVGVTGYRVESCSGASCTSFAQIGTPTATNYSATGLNAATSYSFRVRATDAASNLSAYSNAATATTSAASVVAYVQGIYQTSTSGSNVSKAYASAQTAGNLNVVIVGWSSSSATVSAISDSKGNTYVSAVGPTISSGNATQRIYYAKNIVSAAASGNTVSVTFSTTVSYPSITIAEYSGLDTANPFDIGVGASGSGTAQNTGSVTTTNANDLLVAGNYLSDSTTAAGTGYTQRFVTNGGDLLEDKTVAATGGYTATSTQGVSGWWIIQLAAFRAASSSGDTQAPTSPSSPNATVASSTQINLTWTASTDNVGVTGYLVERCTGASCTSYTQIGSSTTASYSDSGLTASTSYSYRVRATDAAGNLSTYSATFSATTSSGGGSDTTPPTTPAGLAASAASATQISLTWTASTDNVAVTGYNIERCSGPSCTGFAQIATSPSSTYGDTGLSASTNYSYRVRATDAAGNLSGYSNTATTTTQSTPGTTPPSIPGTPTLSVVSSNQISLSWAASTDNVAVLGYLLERCAGGSCTSFSQISNVAVGSYTDSSLAPSTSYSYRVRATDAAGNLSSYSGISSGSTPSGTNSYTYDAAGRLSSVTTYAGTQYYHYDAIGNVISITASP